MNDESEKQRHNICKDVIEDLISEVENIEIELLLGPFFSNF